VFLEPHHVTAAQWFFLRVLWEADALSQADLSDRVGLSTATTVVALNSLEGKGLIKRTPHKSDGRKLVVRLTRRGRTLEKTLRPYGQEIIEIAARGMSQKTLDETRDVMLAMRRNMANVYGTFRISGGKEPYAASRA
jgi:DNA-binding MarR family transcriptional regulator